LLGGYVKTAYKDPRLPAPLVIERDWTAQLTVLSPGEGVTLFWVLRTLYPHDAVPDEVYARAVLGMERLPGAEALRRFCAAVAAAWLLPFGELAETYRIQVLKRFEQTPDFVAVQRLGVRLVYDDVTLWQACGYEGASVHLGGYVKRGFDDLDWLPPLPNDI
jgi:hypothetical protein